MTDDSLQTLQIGQLITVKSWWYDDQRTLRCIVIQDDGPGCTWPGIRIRVQQETGNTHTRYIGADRVISF